MPLNRVALIVVLLVFAGPLMAKPLDFYLPTDGNYDRAIPRPAEIIGHEVGEWHITHDRLVQYMRVLSERSERVQWHQTGTSHEGRPLLLLAISSPRNLARLEEIRVQHLAMSNPRNPAPAVEDMPAIAWMGYSVHGNEPSGSNAAPVVAYHLAAAQDEWTIRLLDETVILFDPSLNPDGLQRFSTWVNSNRGRTLVADPQTREHNEPWPNGRTNHYWFDLNRDWLLLVHPESRARINAFQRWRPNVLTDFHEMGTNATYFFQPGVPSRQNPLFPQRTFDLTAAIGEYHAAALDEAGELYYSKEGFDDFYLGKGSTYPDIHGAIGILFEQASSRGHLQESQQGLLDFPSTIRNQVLTSFSTLRATVDMRVELLRWQRQFYETALASGRRDTVRGWVFGDDGDPERVRRFIEILLAHHIEVHALDREVTLEGIRYRPGHAWVVPTAQPQYLLARGIFETRKEFEDNTFYDVSTWTLPLAFGLPYAEMGRSFNERVVGSRLADALFAPVAVQQVQAYAYAFSWEGFYAPRAAYRLLQAGVRLHAATQPLTVRTGEGAQILGRGAVIIPMGIQEEVDADTIRGILRDIATQDGVVVHAVQSGLSLEGVDLGSPSLRPLELPRVALVTGAGVQVTEAGETWHLLDHTLGMPVTQLELSTLGRMDLSRYTHLILPNGNYDSLSGGAANAVAAWVRGGGVLLATKGAARWAAAQDLVKVEFKNGPTLEDRPERSDYAEARGDSDLQLLRGAIFQTDLDITHPLGWGIARRTLPVFRDSTLFMQLPTDRYVTVARHTESPWLSGYVSPENLTALAGTAAVVVQRAGRGTVVLMGQNMNFRGYWWGTSRVFMNALYFSGMVMPTGNIAGD